MSVTATKADWYPDPSGQHELRYFDGTVWTQHVSSQGRQTVATLVVPPPRPLPKAGAPVALGWVIDVLVGWVVGSVVFGFAFAIIGILAGIGSVADSVGVVVGTVLGIVFMRHQRKTAWLRTHNMFWKVFACVCLFIVVSAGLLFVLQYNHNSNKTNYSTPFCYHNNFDRLHQKWIC